MVVTSDAHPMNRIDPSQNRVLYIHVPIFIFIMMIICIVTPVLCSSLHSGAMPATTGSQFFWLPYNWDRAYITYSNIHVFLYFCHALELLHNFLVFLTEPKSINSFIMLSESTDQLISKECIIYLCNIVTVLFIAFGVCIFLPTVLLKTYTHTCISDCTTYQH